MDKKQSMKIALAGGGTGGHLAIIAALAQEINSQSQNSQSQNSQSSFSFEQPIFIGSLRGQDRAWFEHSPLFKKCYFLPSSPLAGGILAKLKTLFALPILVFRSAKILREHKISALLFAGGYSGAAAAIAAILLRIPLFLHEQNSRAGLANRAFAPFAKKSFCSFTSTLPYPVRAEFLSILRPRTKLKSLLFLGGSQGASFISKLFITLAPKLEAMGICCVLQAGKNYEASLEELKGLLGERDCGKSSIDCGANDTDCGKSDTKSASFRQGRIRVFDFSQSLWEEIKAADFCVSRAGASALFELLYSKTPALFIPYPHAARNHQFFNALHFEQLGLCMLLEQKDASCEAVLKQLEGFDELSQRLWQHDFGQSSDFDQSQNSHSQDLSPSPKPQACSLILSSFSH